MSRIISGEPLPVAPERKGDPESQAYDRKILDYLRRLTAKLQGLLNNNTGALAVYSGISETDVLTSVLSPIHWGTDTRKDSVYEHDTALNTSEITVLLAGFYVILVDIEVLDGATLPAEAAIYLVGPDDGYVNFSASRITGAGTISLSIGVPLPAGAVFEVHVKDSSDPTGGGNLGVRGTRITVMRVSQDDTGGTGTPTGTGYDPDTFIDVVMP